MINVKNPNINDVLVSFVIIIININEPIIKYLLILKNLLIVIYSLSNLNNYFYLICEKYYKLII